MVTFMYADEKAKASTSADERKRWQCTEIGFFSTSAVLLAVFVILSLPEYSTAQAGTPLPLSNDDKTAIMTKINELRADKNALMMDCIFYRYEAHEVGCAKSRCEKITPDKEGEAQVVEGPILWVCAFTSKYVFFRKAFWKQAVLCV
ncbi:hypothetical protein D918_03044 [Trichuris suis]|nr:hypothetical protein D918_03044 [Trichuris suis]